MDDSGSVRYGARMTTSSHTIEVLGYSVPVRTGSGIIFGIVLGTGIGALYGNIALGIAVGTAIGAGLEGAWLAYGDEVSGNTPKATTTQND